MYKTIIEFVCDSDVVVFIRFLHPSINLTSTLASSFVVVVVVVVLVVVVIFVVVESLNRERGRASCVPVRGVYVLVCEPAPGDFVKKECWSKVDRGLVGVGVEEMAVRCSHTSEFLALNWECIIELFGCERARSCW